MASEETAPQTGNTRWEVFERIARIVSLAAIPIVIPLALAIYSARVQESAQIQAINRDYVQLAVSVLKEKKEDVNPELRDWATDLLAEHSPTKFAPSVVTGLKSGAVSFPGIFTEQWNHRVSAISRDGKFIATSDGRGISVWDVGGNKQKTIIDTVSPPAALEFSPDGSTLATGYSDGTVSLMRFDSPGKHSSFKIDQPVSSIKMPSNDLIFVISSTGSLYNFDRKDGLLTRMYFVPRPPSNVSVTTR